MSQSSHTLVASSTSSLLASLWMLAKEVVRHGPSWSVMPPILLALASVITAIATLRRASTDAEIARQRAEQERRNTEALIEARVALIKLRKESVS